MDDLGLGDLDLSVTIDAELERLRKNMLEAGRIVEATSGQMDRASKRAQREFERLERAFDPASKVLQVYERDARKVEIALQRGATTSDRAAAVLSKLNDQYERNISTLGSLTVAEKNAAAAAEARAAQAADAAQVEFNRVLGLERSSVAARDSAEAFQQLFLIEDARADALAKQAQVEINRALGIRETGNSAQASAAIFVETARAEEEAARAAAELARQNEALKLKLDPVHRIQVAIAQQTDEVTRAYQQGLITEERYVAELTRIETGGRQAATSIEVYTTELNKAKAALDAGTISQADFVKAVDRAEAELTGKIEKMGTGWLNVGQRAEGASRRLSGATSASRNLGLAVQNAGYQVGDFAVQVASGQGVLRPFIQQGTQLVSMFGPWGAVIGAAGAVVGALGTSLFSSSEAALSAEASIELLIEATVELNKEVEKSVNLDRSQTQVLLRKAEGIRAETREKIRLIEATIMLREQEIIASRGMAAFESAGANTVVGRLRREVAEARKQLNELGAEFDEQGISLQQLKDSLNGLNSDYDKQIEVNDKLIGAWQQGSREGQIVAKTIEIMGGNFKGTEEQARSLATQLIDQQATLSKLTDRYNDLTKASERERKEAERRQQSADNFVRGIEQEVQLLQMRVDGRANEIPLLEAETRLREILSRDLLPKEREELERLIYSRRGLNEVLERQSEVERKAAEEAKKAARDMERIWDRAGERIQNALADAMFAGKNQFKSFRDFALDMLREIAAAMIFRPFIQPIIAAAQGGFSSGAGGKSSDGLTGLLNGGLSSSTLTQLGLDFATSGLGRMLGLGKTVPKGGAVVSALGVDFAQAMGNLPYAGIGSAIGGLMGLTSGDPLIDMGFSLAGGIGGSMLGAGITALGAAGGPIGAAVGALVGMAASSLFEQKPSNKFAFTGINLEKGTVSDAVYAQHERSQATIDASQKMADTFLSIAKTIEEVTGGKGPAGAWVVAGERDGYSAYVGELGQGWNVQGKKTFSSPEKAVEWMVMEFARKMSGEIDENYRKVLTHGGKAEQMLNDLAFVQALLAETADVVNPLVLALQAVNDNFDTMTERAMELGLTTDLLTKLELKRLEQLAEVQASFDSLGYQALTSALSQLTSFGNQHLLSGQSSLNPLGRQSLAKTTYEQLLEQVQGGDLSKMGDLTGAAGSLLDIARQNYGSTLGFTSIESMVLQGLADLGMTLSTQESVADQITRALSSQTQTQVEKLEDLKDELSKLRQDMKLLAQQLNNAA